MNYLFMITGFFLKIIMYTVSAKTIYTLRTKPFQSIVDFGRPNLVSDKIFVKFQSDD